MTSSININPLMFFVAFLVLGPIFSFKFGKAEQAVPYDVPNYGYVPNTGTGTGTTSGNGFVGKDPAQIVAKALLCFHNNQIYSRCEESYRLTQSGSLNVPPHEVDVYCNGPCLTETHLVLNCIENIMTNFEFYNKATIADVRDTIKGACGFGPERGDFNVLDHMQKETSSTCKNRNRIPVALGFIIIGRALLL